MDIKDLSVEDRAIVKLVEEGLSYPIINKRLGIKESRLKYRVKILRSLGFIKRKQIMSWDKDMTTITGGLIYRRGKKGRGSRKIRGLD